LGVSLNSLTKGAFELDGAKTEQIFTKKFEYPLGRAIQRGAKLLGFEKEYFAIIGFSFWVPQGY
jgi:hypothetical protein